jgi:hypothetical protein
MCRHILTKFSAFKFHNNAFWGFSGCSMHTDGWMDGRGEFIWRFSGMKMRVK